MAEFRIRYAKVLLAYDYQIRGFAAGFASGGTGIVYTLDVHPDFRRRGIGTMLLRALEKELISLGAKRIRLEAAPDSIAALSTYRKAGYSEGELVKNYYGHGKDAMRMWKVPGDSSSEISPQARLSYKSSI